MSLQVRQRCRVLSKGRVRGDKEDFKHHLSFDHHNPEVPGKDRYPPQRKRRAFYEPLV